MKDKMTRLDKVALTSAVSGAVFNVFLFGIGATLAEAAAGSPLFYFRAVAAVLQAAAFDLVAIATVMGMRTGRRSRWSMLTAVTSALVSMLIALDVAGVWHQPWLHAANALIVLAFTLHLLTPSKSTRTQQLRRLVKKLTAQLRQERNLAEFNLASLRTEAERGLLQSASLNQESALLSEQLRTERATVAQLRAELAQKSAELDDASATLSLDVRAIAAQLRVSGVPLRTIGDALGVSEKTIRNWTSEKVEA